MTRVDIEPATRKKVRAAAKEFAGTLVRHPMLEMMMTQALTRIQVPASEDNLDLFLEETVAALHRMVFGQ